MQKKIIALAVAGLSTAAFAQTNVTIYGVADVSGQGYNMGSGKAQNVASSATGLSPENNVKAASGGAFALTNNSSLLGFKGTEALGNGLNALFQMETNVNIAGNSNGGVNSSTTTFNSLRDSYVGLNSKYGTVLGGYLSTPYRAVVTGFDVMPGATGVGRTENLIGNTRLNTQNTAALTGTTSSTIGSTVAQASSSVRATAIAYALPTMYGFNGTLAYTGTNNNGNSNTTGVTAATQGGATINNLTPQGALSLNLGWEGYGVGIKGAFQQAKVNSSTAGTTNVQGYTSYVVGAQYTGMPGLKAAVMYNRNTVGTNNIGTLGAQKGSNNQVWVGASYRFGNNEPRLSFASTSNTSGLTGVGQDGARQWTANWGYYLSKRTQVYGLVSTVSNAANGVYNFAGTGANLAPTGGQNLVTYGAGLRTNF